MPERLVKSAYRQLWRLIKQQPPAQAAAGLKELRETTRSHAGEVNPEQILAHYKELVSRISFLRITTPRAPGTPLQGGRFVLRDGELVEGSGEDKGARWGSRACTAMPCACVHAAWRCMRGAAAAP